MGPTLVVSDQVHYDKYRGENESHRDSTNRVANGMATNQKHFYRLKSILGDMSFLPAGRIQSAVGSLRKVTAGNCYVSRTIDDSMEGIMLAAQECAMTLRQGGGWGGDFSTIRPDRDMIASLGSQASGPVSFMGVFNGTCETIKSAGHRRGAMMASLRCDHPDILQFVRCKRAPAQTQVLWDRAEAETDPALRQAMFNALQATLRLTNFNISVAVTDEFMQAVENNTDFDLKFKGRVYATIRAADLWSEIMRATWDWAEPGVLFIDTINKMNNLWYCEKLASTNPCGEQPLPPFGVCMLGSFNLVRYVVRRGDKLVFDFEAFKSDVAPIVEGMDNIFDTATYPLPQQREEQMNKRRMGLGVTGVANALEALGCPYGSQDFLELLDQIMTILRDTAYEASSDLAKWRGSFPMFDRDKYLDGGFIKTLPENIREKIFEQGIRNSHLLSVAPTGTISLTADNISSGIEPVFAYEYERKMYTPQGLQSFNMQDYGLARFGVRGRTSSDCSIDDHLAVLGVASKYVDSACSKTCNVGPDVSFNQFKDVYLRAWKLGVKGFTTFRLDGKRMGILSVPAKAVKEVIESPVNEPLGAACVYDPATGMRTCDQ